MKWDLAPGVYTLIYFAMLLFVTWRVSVVSLSAVLRIHSLSLSPPNPASGTTSPPSKLVQLQRAWAKLLSSRRPMLLRNSGQFVFAYLSFKQQTWLGTFDLALVTVLGALTVGIISPSVWDVLKSFMELLHKLLDWARGMP